MVSASALWSFQTCQSPTPQACTLRVFSKDFALVIVAFMSDGVLLALPKEFDLDLACLEYDCFLGYFSVLYPGKTLGESEEIITAACSRDVARLITELTRAGRSSCAGITLLKTGGSQERWPDGEVLLGW